MIGNLNHVAIVVPDLAVASALYRDAYGASVSEPQALPEHGVTTVFVELPNTKIELLHPLGDDSPIAKFLTNNPAGGIHHLCYEVDDVEQARKQLAHHDIRVLGDGGAKLGAHGKPVIFLHPKDSLGALIELEQTAKVDKLYADKLPRIGDFVFDDLVAEVFPDMIRRSVPGYETIISLLGIIAERHLQRDAIVYDLGCSLGTSMHAIAARIQDPSIQFIGVDNSASMLQKCRSNLKGVIAAERLTLTHGDVRDVKVQDASLVVLNFTLQFLEQDDRLELLSGIYAGLKDGGALVVSEKIRLEDSATGRWQQSMHDQFKVANGYSALEIAQKRASLEKVMVLDSPTTHLARLRQAGFPQVEQWFQAFNFCSFVALK